MSTSIDYQFETIKCPHCGYKNEITITREQDNSTCELSTSFPTKVECISCERKINVKKVLNEMGWE